MIQEWREIDLDLFRQIFSAYLNHQGDTEGKVLEIQNISGIYFEDFTDEDGSCCRIFLGAGMNPLEFREFNELVAETYDKFGDLDPEFQNKIEEDLKILNVCYFQSGQPLISPIGATKKTIDIFFLTCFGGMSEIAKFKEVPLEKFEHSILWYSKDSEGNVKYNNLREDDISDLDKLIRVRVMDLSDWKKMVYEGITLQCFPDRYKTEDLHKEDIRWG